MGRAQSSVTDHSQVSGKLFVRVSGEGGVCIWLLSMLDMCTRPSVPGRGFPGEEHAVCQSGETGDHRSPRERQTCRRS